MANYETKNIPIDQLFLDPRNPRFITPPNPQQNDIIRYLIQNEEVEKLALSIAQNKGLYPGERIIVCAEDNHYIVLEGNRRTCACKILNNIRLLTNIRPASSRLFLNINQETIKSTQILEADVMDSRVFAQKALAAKHIDGIKKWSPISKKKFFSIQFDQGKSLQEISDITGSNKNTVCSGIKEFKLIQYTLDLPFWTTQEKSTYLNLEDLKVSRFTRVFAAKKGCNDAIASLKELLLLSENEMYNPVSSLPQNQFDFCLYLIAKAAFVDKDDFDTRSTYLDVPGLTDYMIQHEIMMPPSSQPLENKNTTDSPTVPSPPTHKAGNLPSTINEPSLQSPITPPAISATVIKTDKQTTSKRNTVIPASFCPTCASTKINNITTELSKLDVHKFTNACAVLLRIYLELSSKYYLEQMEKPDKINESSLLDTLKNTVDLMQNKKEISDKVQKNLNALIKKEHIVTIFNGYVHYNNVHPSADSIVNYFDNFEPFLKVALSK